jgi:hypothetical protein
MDGCDGGTTLSAYDYVNTAGGIESASDYPYTSYWGDTGKCKSSSADFLVNAIKTTSLLESQ